MSDSSPRCASYCADRSKSRLGVKLGYRSANFTVEPLLDGGSIVGGEFLVGVGLAAGIGSTGRVVGLVAATGTGVVSLSDSLCVGCKGREYTKCNGLFVKWATISPYCSLCCSSLH